MSTELLKIPKLPRPENMPMIELNEDGKAYLETAEKVAQNPIQPGSELIIANEYANTINRLVKAVDGQRLESTKPMRDFLSEYKAAVDSKTEKATEIFKQLKDGIFECDRKIQVAHQEENKKAEAEEDRRRKIQESHKERGHEVKEDITPVVRPISPDITSPIKWRKDWTWKLTDVDKIPREYLVIDTVAINKDVKGGAREIPGIEIFQKKTQVHG